jgi:hypothetical protein
MTEQAKPKPNIIAGLMRIIEEFDNLVKEVDWLKKTLNELESVCEEE